MSLLLDQTNDQGKSRQIELMKDISQSAAPVVAWFQPVDSDSLYVMHHPTTFIDRKKLVISIVEKASIWRSGEL